MSAPACDMMFTRYPLRCYAEATFAIARRRDDPLARSACTRHLAKAVESLLDQGDAGDAMVYVVSYARLAAREGTREKEDAGGS